MKYIEIEHPITIKNNAQKRFVDDIRNSPMYSIIKDNVLMNDDVYRAKKDSIEELSEKGFQLDEDFTEYGGIDDFILLAQYEIASEQLAKRLESGNIYTDAERLDILFANDCYPSQVTLKGLIHKLTNNN